MDRMRHCTGAIRGRVYHRRRLTGDRLDRAVDAVPGLSFDFVPASNDACAADVDHGSGNHHDRRCTPAG